MYTFYGCLLFPPTAVGVADTFWLFIFTLNRAKKWFNSKLNKKYSFKKFKNYSKIIQFKKFKKLFIKIGKIIPAWENSENMQNGPFFSSKRTCYSFFLWISHFFYSFKNSFNSTAKIFIQRIYSFNSTAKNSFKEFIHSKNNLIIHSMKIFIFLKNAVSATPTFCATMRVLLHLGWVQSHSNLISATKKVQKFKDDLSLHIRGI